jgi:pimeloyl-ACP methyl ester carboxylesterase
MRYLNEQADDVEAAYRTVAAYPGVDTRKMSIMGHSFGGQVALFTNTHRLGQKAAISFAPGSESWEGDPCLPDGGALPTLCSPYPRGVLQEFLYRAIDLARSPVFFFDVQNDVSVKGVYELPYWGWSTTRALHQATLFRPVAGLSCKFPDVEGKPVRCGVDEPTKVCPADPETGETEKCGNVAHSVSATDPGEIAKWVPAVLEFLERYGAR